VTGWRFLSQYRRKSFLQGGLLSHSCAFAAASDARRSDCIKERLIQYVAQVGRSDFDRGRDAIGATALALVFGAITTEGVNLLLYSRVEADTLFC
jgi:hypothetical protein